MKKLSNEARTRADCDYQELLDGLLGRSEAVVTRNSKVYRQFVPLIYHFESAPLVTLRKTAWKKALREMEWFMSGVDECPEELRDWWAGQLSPDNKLLHGYPKQLRYSPNSVNGMLDQVAAVLHALQTNPYSRRLIMTTWNPGDMWDITETNENPNTPTCCHATMIQFSVDPGRDGKPETLNTYHYQRSADVLLGLPHNWMQHWALLTFFAHHAGLKVGQLSYQVGDLHLYAEESHLQAAIEVTQASRNDSVEPMLHYHYSGAVDHIGLPAFKAADFSLSWPAGIEVPKPVTTIKPRLL